MYIDISDDSFDVFVSQTEDLLNVCDAVSTKEISIL